MLVGPEMIPGADGAVLLSVNGRMPLVPQEFTACTFRLQLLNAFVNNTVITVSSVLPDPFGCVICTFAACDASTYQLYDDADVTLGILNVIGTAVCVTPTGSVIAVQIPPVETISDGVNGYCAVRYFDLPVALMPQTDFAFTVKYFSTLGMLEKPLVNFNLITFVVV
jgi:hypothetical protein